MVKYDQSDYLNYLFILNNFCLILTFNYFINHISILFTSSLLVNEYSSSLIRTTSSVQISLYRHFYGQPH